LKTTAKLHNAPRLTLQRYVNDSSQNPKEALATILGRKTILPKEIENILCNYYTDMDTRYFGLSAADVRRLAYQLPIRNRLPHSFSKDKPAAGNKWLKGFFRRHPHLSMRSQQGISAARVKSFTPDNLRKFFSILERQIDRIGHSPSRILNVDKTAITIVQGKHHKMVSLKGKRQVTALTSAEKGNICALKTCMNAADAFVPPMLIFSRKNMKPELMEGAPPGAILYCHPSS
jgi:hypothetical protein